jgi:POT family proton-dependent oligopeptide transporter
VFWLWLAQRGRDLSSVLKMALGCTLVGLSFVIMILAAHGAGADAKHSVLWLVGMTVVITMGELYLSPVGLSFVTKIAPARMVSMLMGVWFLANFFGNYLSGYLGTYWEKMPHERFFSMLMALGIGAGAIMFLISRPVDRVVAHHDRGTVPTS